MLELRALTSRLGVWCHAGDTALADMSWGGHSMLGLCCHAVAAAHCHRLLSTSSAGEGELPAGAAHLVELTGALVTISPEICFASTVRESLARVPFGDLMLSC